MQGQEVANGDFKSPKHKLISLFHLGRAKWRKRAQEYHHAMRDLNITVRDLRNSRDGWKRKYQQERERRLKLERLLGRSSREPKAAPD